jgi:hypothetical protein
MLRQHANQEMVVPKKKFAAALPDISACRYQHFKDEVWDILLPCKQKALSVKFEREHCKIGLLPKTTIAKKKMVPRSIIMKFAGKVSAALKDRRQETIAKAKTAAIPKTMSKTAFVSRKGVPKGMKATFKERHQEIKKAAAKAKAMPKTTISKRTFLSRKCAPKAMKATFKERQQEIKKAAAKAKAMPKTTISKRTFLSRKGAPKAMQATFKDRQQAIKKAAAKAGEGFGILAGEGIGNDG